jgi:pimeloyl-ACP methyl ester carboxylesterase
MRAAALMLTSLTLVAVGGCSRTFTDKAANGITFFCPGVGNTDFAYLPVRRGLEQAGYQGEIDAFVWTLTFLPLDQALGPIAKLRAADLSRIIDDYIEQYPEGKVNLIGLSAGSGIALWAAERLDDGHKVDNIVLLSSSLSHDYDVGRALRHVRGKIYVYYSKEDGVLGVPMKLVGTIDGKRFTDAAGAVGLTSRKHAGRIVNIPWTAEYLKYGYAGGHMDSTQESFIAAVVAPHIIGATPQGGRETAAIRTVEGPAAAGKDQSHTRSRQ